MKLFLTSSPCDNHVPTGVELPCILNQSNDFVKNLSACWKPNARGLIICASPDKYQLNNEMKDTFQKAFAFHGLSISEMEACDARNASQFPELLKDRDVIILGGGHVPTQNAFFQQIGLKNMIQNYEGIVIGISAGTMNSAKTVYAQPEIEGESIDSEYQRFIPGLGLTEVMIIPHYQQVKNYYLDGKRVFEDITYPDSMGRKFYALVDGSYVLVQDGKTELYGEAYLIQDGKLTQICREGQKLEL